VEPNALTTIAARVVTWLDARGPDPATLDRWLAAVRDAAEALAARTGVGIELRVESRSDGTTFDPDLRARLVAAGGGLPELPCWAGHDAGILAARRPTAMLLVRNPTGVSHAPEEQVDLADAAAAADVVLRALEDLP
jgi:N-carbamoyl-L-amino-acid hydrolase